LLGYQNKGLSKYKIVDNQEIEKLRLPSGAEIGKAYAQGQEAVTALFYDTFVVTTNLANNR